MMRAEIEAQINAAKREKYPNVPAFAIPKTKLKDNGANNLTSSIIKYITLKGGWATRINTAGVWQEDKKKFRPTTTEKGTADIHGCFKGRHLSIEVKYKKDTMKDKQKEMMEKVTNAGGLYIIARTLDQFISDFDHEFGL